MSIADACGPAGLGFVFMGMALAGPVNLFLGMGVSAFGFLLIAVSR